MFAGASHLMARHTRTARCMGDLRLQGRWRMKRMSAESRITRTVRRAAAWPSPLHFPRSSSNGTRKSTAWAFELPAELQGLRNRYGSGEGVKFAHWEITFRRTWSDPVELDAIAGYGMQQAAPETASVTNVTISENEEKDGLEIRFPAKPSAEVLDALKANGWRWSRFSSCWYARRSDKARQFAASLTAA